MTTDTEHTDSEAHETPETTEVAEAAPEAIEAAPEPKPAITWEREIAAAERSYRAFLDGKPTHFVAFRHSESELHEQWRLIDTVADETHVLGAAISRPNLEREFEWIIRGEADPAAPPPVHESEVEVEAVHVADAHVEHADSPTE